MTDETGASAETPAVETAVTEPSLAEFSNEFFNKEAPEAPVETPAEEAAPEDEALAEEPSTETDEAGDDELVPEPEVKKKKTIQERFNELSAKAHEAERRENAERIAREALEAKLDDALAKIEQKKEPAPQPVKTDAPDPSDTNEDGTDKYPLGEFDPSFVRDTARYEFNELVKERDQAETEKQAQARNEAEKLQLQNSWKEKTSSIADTLPDFAEKTAELVDVFKDVPLEVGEYIASTVMAMDRGPEVLYYLADHPDEARKIVSSNPVSATIALGRLEGQLPSKKETTPPKVSQAPEPPVARNKGTGQFESRDPNDLAAFSKKFFEK